LEQNNKRLHGDLKSQSDLLQTEEAKAKELDRLKAEAEILKEQSEAKKLAEEKFSEEKAKEE